MDSQRSTVGGWPIAVAVQHPTIYMHVYWRVCAPRRGRGTQAVLSLPHVPQPDVFCAVVVCVELDPVWFDSGYATRPIRVRALHLQKLLPHGTHTWQSPQSPVQLTRQPRHETLLAVHPEVGLSLSLRN